MCGCKTEEWEEHLIPSLFILLPVRKNINSSTIPSLPAVQIFTGALDVQCTGAFNFLLQRKNNMERVDNERLGVHPSFERGLYLEC